MKRRSMTNGASAGADFGLADLFGVTFAARPRARCRTPTCAWRTILARPAASASGRARRRAADHQRAYRLASHPRREFPHAPLTLIPCYPDLPMEEVYPRVPATDIAEVYLREVGPRPGGLFPLGHRPHLLGGPCRRPRDLAPQRRELGNERGAARGRHRARRAGRDLWRQQDSMTVHLVNLTNPMMMKGPFRELIPFGEQQVVVRLPAGVDG